MTEEEEEQIQEIWYKVVKRADRYILTTLHSYFDKVRITLVTEQCLLVLPITMIAFS